MSRRQEQIRIDGKHYLVETALRSQFALIHAFLADYLGNLSYALSARNSFLIHAEVKGLRCCPLAHSGKLIER